MEQGKSDTELVGKSWVALSIGPSLAAQTTASFVRYAGRLLRIIAVAAGVLKFRLAAILALSLIAIAARGGALGSLMLFLRQVLGRNQSTPRWLELLAFGPNTPIWSGLLCFGLFAITAFASFACAWLSASSGIYCTRQVICNQFSKTLAGIEKIDKSMVANVVSTCSIFFARLVRATLAFPLAFLTFLLGLGFLFWINVPMTLGVLLVMPAILLPLYFLNRGTVRDNRELRHLGSDVAEAKKTAVKAIQEDASEQSIQRALNNYFYEKNVYRRYQILVRNWTLRPRVGLVGELFSNGLLVGLAFGLPLLLSTAQELLPDLLGFVVSLRFTMTAVQDISRQMTMVNRFLEPAECVLDPSLAAVRFPKSGDDDLDDDALNEI